MARVWHRAVPGDPARPRRAQARFRVARPLCQPPPIRTGLGCGGMPASRCRLDRCDLNRGRLRRCRLKRFSLNRCRLNRCRLNCCRLNRRYSDRCRSDRRSSAVRPPSAVRRRTAVRRPPSVRGPPPADAIRPPYKDTYSGSRGACFRAHTQRSSGRGTGSDGSWERPGVLQMGVGLSQATATVLPSPQGSALSQPSRLAPRAQRGASAPRRLGQPCRAMRRASAMGAAGPRGGPRVLGSAAVPEEGRRSVRRQAGCRPARGPAKQFSRISACQALRRAGDGGL